MHMNFTSSVGGVVVGEGSLQAAKELSHFMYSKKKPSTAGTVKLAFSLVDAHL